MKTAVKWLFSQLSINNITLDKGTKAHQEMEQKIFKQAQEMEREQIKDAYLNGRYDADKIVMSNNFYAKQYYNETFKQQEQ